MAIKETAMTTAQSLQGAASVSTTFPVHSKNVVISDVVSHEADVLAQFKANLNQLEELTHRLKFVLGDVNGLIKKRR